MDIELKPKINDSAKRILLKELQTFPLTKPFKLNTILHEKLSLDEIPTMNQIQDFKKNFKKKKNCGKTSKEIIHDLLLKDVNQKYIVMAEDIFSENWMIILRSGEKTFQQFIDNVQSEESAIGLDAQFKNNLNHLPLWIICAQNDSYNTVPGFIIMAEKNNKNILKKAISEVIKYLKENDICWKATVMIDKDNVERYALDQNGLKIILCEFHLIKTISEKFKKKASPALQGKLFLLFKKISRASTVERRSMRIQNIEKFCEENSLEELSFYLKKNWFCSKWVDCWTDVHRPGDRLGLFSTNNASESWFRVLLRSYLEGKSQSPAVVIEEILSKVLPQTELRTVHRSNGWERRINSTAKLEEKSLAIASDIILKKKIQSVGMSKFQIFHSKDTVEVKLNPDKCSCINWLWFGKMCCHLKAAHLFKLKAPTGVPSSVPPRFRSKSKYSRRKDKFGEIKTVVGNANKTAESSSSEDNESEILLDLEEILLESEEEDEILLELEEEEEILFNLNQVEETHHNAATEISNSHPSLFKQMEAISMGKTKLSKRIRKPKVIHDM